MKIRQGRRNGHNLYLQVGNQPEDNDPCIGFMIDPKVAELLSSETAENARLLSEIKMQVEDGA